MRRDYPTLRNLISGWFHQDFDLAGDNLEAVMANYGRTASFEERKELGAEIRALLETEDATIEETLDRSLGFELDPAGWGLSSRGFLECILACLG